MTSEGARPIIPQEDRAAALVALRFVDAVTIVDKDTPLEVLQSVRPHVLVKGATIGSIR